MTTTAQDQAKKETTTALTMASAELKELDGWIIVTAEDSDFAAEMTQSIIVRKKALEAKRKTITKPLNAATKAVNDLFRPPREALEKIEQTLKQKIAGYLQTIEARNELAIAQVASAGTAEEATAALATVQQIDAPKGVGIRYKWKAEIFSPEIVPNEFRTPDLQVIQIFTDAAVKANGEPTAIAGVKFEKIPIVTSRKV